MPLLRRMSRTEIVVVGVLVTVVIYQRYNLIKAQSEENERLCKDVENMLLCKDQFKSIGGENSDGLKLLKRGLPTVVKTSKRVNRAKWADGQTNTYKTTGKGEKWDSLANLQDDEEKYFNATSPRIAIIVYVPYRLDKFFIYQFASLTYSSWKYINSHKEIARKTKIPGWKNLDSLVISDLLIWCAKLACPDLPKDCLPHTAPIIGYNPECRWFAQEEHPDAKVHDWISVFQFASLDSFKQVSHLYDYVFRIDSDVLLTPGFLAWYPNGREAAFGNAYHCTEYNMKRLTDIAKKLNIRNQNVHCIASSLYMTPNLTLNVCPLTVQLFVYLAKKEFVPKLPDLEHMFDSTSERTWPTWWRGVSLLHATELALNVHVKNISEGYTKNILDQGTCDNYNSILSMVQLHCYQDQWQFRKFDFMDAVKNVFQTQILDQRLFTFYADRDATNMSPREYATFIAWHGAANYVNPIKFWVRSSLSIKEDFDKAEEKQHKFQYL